MKTVVALKYVLTLKEALIVNVTVAIYWMLMELLVMVYAYNRVVIHVYIRMYVCAFGSTCVYV